MRTLGQIGFDLLKREEMRLHFALNITGGFPEAFFLRQIPVERETKIDSLFLPTAGRGREKVPCNKARVR